MDIDNKRAPLLHKRLNITLEDVLKETDIRTLLMYKSIISQDVTEIKNKMANVKLNGLPEEKDNGKQYLRRLSSVDRVYQTFMGCIKDRIKMLDRYYYVFYTTVKDLIDEEQFNEIKEIAKAKLKNN